MNDTNSDISARENTDNDIFDLKRIRNKNPNRPIIVQLNVNSIRNKFHSIKSLIADNVDILMLSETKVDDSFPTSQFLIDGFSKPFRLDRCSNGGGIFLYVRDDISSNLLTQYKIEDNIECLYVEVNIRKKKWLLY